MPPEHINKQQDGIMKFLEQVPAFITAYTLVIKCKHPIWLLLIEDDLFYYIAFHRFVWNPMHAVNLT